MIKIYADNGLPFFNALWLRDRNYIQTVLADTMRATLIGVNKAWQIEQIEAPCLIPVHLVSKEYDQHDLFVTDIQKETGQFILKPETTATSYAYAAYRFEHQEATPPYCVWQASKSFRRENDQVTKNVRLKEFYQQEFQCIVTEDTKMDYQANTIIDEVYFAIEHVTGRTCRIVPSDRLPSYSDKTVDIEAWIPEIEPSGIISKKGKWLEVCSISKRHDVPFTWNDKPLLNYEFAFGLDRLTYAKQKLEEV